jgi:hypothetical protein
MARLRLHKAKPKKAAPLPGNPLQAMLPLYLEWMRVSSMLFMGFNSAAVLFLE